MIKEALNLLDRERVCVLVVVQTDGAPCAAAMHYSHSEDPLELYFSTEKGSRKGRAAFASDSVKASVVVGWNETEFVTLQMDGVLRAVQNPAELARIRALHYKKQPQAEQYKDDPETLFLTFVPAWWRYTDYKTDPPTILQ